MQVSIYLLSQTGHQGGPVHVQTRSARLLAVVMAGVLLAAACGGDDDDAAKDTTDTTAAPAEDAVAPASGEPVTIGFVNMEDGPLAQPTIGAAAEAARKYINEKLGGIKGHPLEFEKCSTS